MTTYAATKAGDAPRGISTARRQTGPETTVSVIAPIHPLGDERHGREHSVAMVDTDAGVAAIIAAIEKRSAPPGCPRGRS